MKPPFLSFFFSFPPAISLLLIKLLRETSIFGLFVAISLLVQSMVYVFFQSRVDITLFDYIKYVLHPLSEICDVNNRI